MTGRCCSRPWSSPRLTTGPRPPIRSPRPSVTGCAASTGGCARWGRRSAPTAPPADYHELRKKGKELRYLLELFGPQLFDPDAVGELVGSLKDLQELLGRHQDREVQISLLIALADEVAGLPRGPRALMAMGVLVDRLRADEAAARTEFAAAFAQLVARERRRLVKATFA